MMMPGSVFDLNEQASPFIRMSFAYAADQDIVEGIRCVSALVAGRRPCGRMGDRLTPWRAAPCEGVYSHWRAGAWASSCASAPLSAPPIRQPGAPRKRSV